MCYLCKTLSQCLDALGGKYVPCVVLVVMYENERARSGEVFKIKFTIHHYIKAPHHKQVVSSLCFQKSILQKIKACICITHKTNIGRCPQYLF